jgi:hypothetical protein
MLEAADEGVEAALEGFLETDETKGELAAGVVLLVDDGAEYEARERAHCRRGLSCWYPRRDHRGVHLGYEVSA